MKIKQAERPSGTGRRVGDLLSELLSSLSHCPGYCTSTERTGGEASPVSGHPWLLVFMTLDGFANGQKDTSSPRSQEGGEPSIALVPPFPGLSLALAVL